MLSWFIDSAHAMGTQGQGGEAPNPIVSFLPIILMFAIFYFLLIRPQQKRMKEHKAMVEAIQRGDEVLTTGGIIGKVTGVGEDLTVEIADGVRVRLQRQAVTQVLKRGG